MNLRRLLIFAVATAFCVGCDKKSEGDPTPQTATQPTVAKPAAQKVELTLALLPQGDPKAYGAHADALAAFLEEQTGYAIEVVAAPTYADEIQAMRKGDVQVAMFAGWAYLEAHMTADASLLLAETVDGKPHVGSRWYTAKDSKLSELSDLRGKRVAFTSPSEPSVIHSTGSPAKASAPPSLPSALSPGQKRRSTASLTTMARRPGRPSHPSLSNGRQGVRSCRPGRPRVEGFARCRQESRIAGGFFAGGETRPRRGGARRKTRGRRGGDPSDLDELTSLSASGC